MQDPFLANFIHELRTLISGVFASTNLLSKSLRGRPEAADLVKAIRLNNSRILDLINNALDLSKIEAGRMTIERAPVDPGQLVAELVSLLRPRAAEKGLNLDAECPGPIPRTITTDPTRLRQILMNLLDNAIKFTDRGGVRLVIELRRHPTADEGGGLLFHVIDTGVGIDEEHRREVFEPFIQAEPSTARRYGGTGLGLAISRELARLIGAELSLETGAGEGSTFTLALPAASVGSAALVDHLPRLILEPARRVPVRSSAAPRGEPLSGLRVLLIEDRPASQLLLAAMLKSSGAAVQLARGGGDAIRRVEAALHAKHPPDTILMNPRLRGGDRISPRLRDLGYRGPILAIAPSVSSIETNPEHKSHDRNNRMADLLDTPELIHAILRATRSTATPPADDKSWEEGV